MIDSNDAMRQPLPPDAFKEAAAEGGDIKVSEEEQEDPSSVARTYVGLALRVVLAELRRRICASPKDQYVIIFYGWCARAGGGVLTSLP